MKEKINAVFSGQDINFSNEVFEGADTLALFGGIELDLSKAVFNDDVHIKATALFGGVDILLPKSVNVKVNSHSIFGGVSNKHENNIAEPFKTVYIDVYCAFGGVDVK